MPLYYFLWSYSSPANLLRFKLLRCHFLDYNGSLLLLQCHRRVSFDRSSSLFCREAIQLDLRSQCPRETEGLVDYATHADCVLFGRRLHGAETLLPYAERH